MPPDPLEDVVSGQYERWVYPEPILDLPAWLEDNWQWFDPSHSSRLLWPDRDYREGLDILVAGCGTNQAAVLAFTNPSAHVVAIDVSAASLSHHRYLADKYALHNLELKRLPIEEVATLGRDFDLIVSTGVLHHLADPLEGMRALGGRLRDDAVLAVMLYARYGRAGVDMLQGVFRDLGLRQDEPSLAIVREALGDLDDSHPIHRYMSMAPDLQFDGGLVDTFLHGRERHYTIGECVDLVTDAGLVFQDVFLKTPYHPFRPEESAFRAAIAALPREAQWSVMERINARNACHFFTASRPERPVSSYEIDIAGTALLDLVPSLRFRVELVGHTIRRPGWSLGLSPAEAAAVALIDGRRTIGEITIAAGADGALFRRLWHGDFIALGLTSQP